MLLAVVYVPALAVVFDVRDPGPRGWGLVLAMGAVPLVLGQAVAWFKSRVESAP